MAGLVSSWRRLAAGAPALLTLAALLGALAMANSPLRPLYQLVHHTPVALRVGELMVAKPLISWINEGLMVFFFLLVALEIKREVLQGHLSSPARFALPAIGAAGGMLVPALVFLALTWGDPLASRGWAIPTATDTVLALAAASALGARVPASVKVFLTALAIFDDLGAIVILAALFTTSLSVPSLLVAGGALLALAAINALGVARPSAYVVAGTVLWAAVLESGVHATLAGFLIGLAIPLRAKAGTSPLVSAERGLRPWVALGVVPVFAFFNAGVQLEDPLYGGASAAVALGVAAALVLGKPAGILGAAWIAVRLGIARLPAGALWRHIRGSAMLAGIGFTMSLFFAGLAFGTADALAISARIGILAGSLLSAVLGMAVLARSPERAETPQAPADAKSETAAASLRRAEDGA